jgi:hypothetical protein
VLAKGEFPTRDNCDPENPEEAFLWMFAGLPLVKGAPLIMPIEYFRHVSKRMWDLGARPAAEPLLEWVAPSATEPNWLTSPGRWVPAGEAPKRSEHDQARDGIARMSLQQKAELLKALKADRLPDTPAGNVVKALSAGQRKVILEVLQEVSGA